MEMDQLVSKDQKSNTEDWFVHIQYRKLKQLLQQSISARTNYALTVFSHADNTARRMLVGFPELRGTPLTTSIAIVGFGPVGEGSSFKIRSTIRLYQNLCSPSNSVLLGNRSESSGRLQK